MAGPGLALQGASIQDITQRKEAEADVVFLAYHDKLTGLLNRAVLRSISRGSGGPGRAQ